ncbi:MAG TPA: DMT family transporter [Thermoplasmata archaeon]|nr:DMT family transporter [Thermoplasmata archaeon]
MKISKNLAYGMMAFAAVMWGTSGTLTVLAIDAGATANQVALFGTLASAVILVSILMALDRGAFKIRAKDLPALTVFAVITGTLFSLAWYNAINLTSVSTALVLLYSYPSMVTVASVFLLGEKMTASKMVALPLTFLGCVLVAEAYDLEAIRLNIWGVALGLFTAFAATVYYVWAKKLLLVYSSNTLALYMTLLMIPGLLVAVNPFSIIDNPLSMDAWLYIFLIGLLPGTFGFVVAMIALRHIEASRASMIAGVEPVSGVILAVIFIAESVDALQSLGVVLVIAAVFILRFTQKEEEPIVEAPPTR